jgi:hypothetical protein
MRNRSWWERPEMTTTCNIHYGSIESIPTHASHGLLFLKSFLPILDSLDESPAITPHVSSTAQFITNRDSPISIESLLGMFRMRHKMLQSFKHDVSKAWEISTEKGCTVIFESVSTTRFKNDDVKIGVAEMNVWELEREEGSEELKLVEARCWMNPVAIQNRAKEIFGAK